MTNPNKAYIDELYFQYLKDPDSLSPRWRDFFESEYEEYSSPTGEISTPAPPKQSARKAKSAQITLPPGAALEELPPIPAKIASNMEESLEIPTAVSVRTIPVKALDENRRIINRYLVKHRRRKVSFTHMLLWAIVRALAKFPRLNDSFAKSGGKAYRAKNSSINIGLAIDVKKDDGSRLLLVPNVKNAQNLNFDEFVKAFDELIFKTRNNKLSVDDLQGATVTLTNPGMIGTSFSSPRLMKGQGLIVAVGAIDYPVEFQAVKPDTLASLAVSKVVTISNTYDHRITQGAESAEFLSYIHQLLIGKKRFYDHIFATLSIPFEPVRWETDQPTKAFSRDDKLEEIEKSAHVMQMINAYRVRGHLLASINPLGFQSYYYPELDPAYYGFTIWDLDREFHCDDAWERNNIPLREIIELLRETYCGPLGFEFMHIQSPERKEWIKSTLEKTRSHREYTSNEKIRILRKIIEAEEFENFLHTKFIGHKRFSLEGAESLIPMLDIIFENAADNKLNHIVIGMAHRGRLNVLVNNIGKDRRRVFNEFDGEIDPDSYQGSGDVKYHLGDQGFYTSSKNNSVSIILSPNPSHLELVDPVIEGMARALDNEIDDKSYSKSMPLLVHGDAAFAGQGIVAETLNMSQLDGYKTGGTIHIIVNNQIGFTTTSHMSRSTIYATDIAKMLQIPIFHVNGNDPEAVATAASVAFEYRQKFKSDVIIDMLCYRKYGHNEADEPSYTQPLLYKKINSMKPVSKVFEKALISEKILAEDEAEKIRNEVKNLYNDEFSSRKDRKIRNPITYRNKSDNMLKPVRTGVDEKILRKIGETISAIPQNFNANPKVVNLLKKRRKMIDSDKAAIDWAMAEALAIGSILLEGKEIRFSGQDSRRGTFSQRHSVLTDMINENEICPLNTIQPGQALLRIFDSPLSELGVLGFEYGYSVASTNGLTFWEAQFGDFANMAQPIVDQFIACGEVKWGQTSNLVMLLPHSYDGQGPEHSSARLERYLQLCAESNMIVGNLSTPAQYFHFIRRQANASYRKPAILMTPKSMLRHSKAVSSLDELSNGFFRPIIDGETLENNSQAKRVILCSGKIYWELLQYSEKNEISDAAIVRIEQIYPFDSEQLAEILSSYENASEVVWMQEEPKNAGAWKFLAMRLRKALAGEQELFYVGREETAATAAGSIKTHMREQERIIKSAFGELG